MKNFFKTLGKFTLPALAALATSLVACSGSTEFENAGGTSDEAEGIIAISNKTIAGVSQKGPFVTGSTVTLKETSGAKLTPSGREFIATIRNDKGEFKIDNISLESQFAQLTARGYYIGESKLSPSDCEVSLNAISDVSKRDEININIFTHIQHDRILQLVKKGKSFTSAKKQATKELMKAFGNEDLMDDPENLNITGNGYADQALLFISSLLDEYFAYDLTDEYTSGSEEHCQAVQRTLDNMATEFADKGKFSKETLLPLTKNALYDPAEYYAQTFCSNLIGTYFEAGECTDKKKGDYFTLEPFFGKDVYDTVKADNLIGSYVVCANGAWGVYSLQEFNPAYAKLKHQVGTMTDPRDGKVYRTTSFTYNKIKYEWMADELDYMKENKSCQDVEFENEKCPAKYTWAEAMNIDLDQTNNIVSSTLFSTPHQGICPDGWHIPQSNEWNDLIHYVGTMYSLLYYSLNSLDFNGGWADYHSYPQNRELLNFDMTPILTAPAYTIWSPEDYVEDSEFYAISPKEGSYLYPINAYVRCVKNY